MEHEQRRAPRKALHRPATVIVDGSSCPGARTQDVSVGGVCVVLHQQVAPGQVCAVEFDIPVKGRHMKVRGVGKGAYSVCVGVDGFRVGVQFLHIDDASLSAIRAYMSVMP